jgi:hypothetical protein
MPEEIKGTEPSGVEAALFHGESFTSSAIDTPES